MKPCSYCASGGCSLDNFWKQTARMLWGSIEFSGTTLMDIPVHLLWFHVASKGTTNTDMCNLKTKVVVRSVNRQRPVVRQRSNIYVTQLCSMITAHTQSPLPSTAQSIARIPELLHSPNLCMVQPDEVAFSPDSRSVATCSHDPGCPEFRR